ncbi:hypothetical protein MYP_2794 [Sporocytophaga myxococcoides]|uniref:Helicase ATP-binding domain-containing protein n=1 Tax=Sporocytophaga myxococcoides TaxID=153721 RepID=A0A098LF37_9BACT|nr:type I restriction endonuclease [Sporocytophaga myxococcoides]GAL85565.1 hypothetical protein MYP_2794 [Sporocytophaga myxococcoides]
MSKHKEIRFEEYIEQYLLTQAGYCKGNPKDFDAVKGIFEKDFLEFIAISQPSRWKTLQEFHGKSAGEALVKDLLKELAAKGVLHVLRHGFKCFGKLFRLAYFAPNTNLNPTAWEDYQKNILTVNRQVHFSEKNRELSLDMVLAVNGIPVVTLELKNAMTNQRVENAIRQYKEDRDPEEAIFRFKERSLVHFALDTEMVFMTTRLNKEKTFFLPFNKGYNMGGGNPPSEDGNYPVAYLWEEILTRDSLLDIIGRFIHLQVEEKQELTEKGLKTVKKETMIFPRYHQISAVRQLVGHSREHGAGRNYLIQHSAGSGKSNSIAWLAHRLSSLHNEQDEKIFDTVVVITDRRILDQQLQDTIYQFEHKQGVVQKIDENTQQLVKALSTGVPVIISTIQKFPFIFQAIETLEKKGEKIELSTKGKTFAVIVDEAHSSQSGEAAMELRKVLNKDGIESAIAEQILDMEDEPLSDEAKEAMAREMLKRPRQKNISFFAFTATPKYKTLIFFDEPGKEGKFPFHHYSMKQAIEEGFIMDVLKHYTTYTTYFKLVKSAEDDPKLPKNKAAKALARFLVTHPYNLRQKVEVMVEHFRLNTRHRIGGMAKAMVVTGSRLQAVRYKQTFDSYIKEKGYTDIKSLVAFSGSVKDPDLNDVEYTEPGLNLGIKETELPQKFSTGEYQVLIVAEKYQTGFDQPLLHTMYVDKKLSGIQAVQTLSRLNRTAPGKSETFVLDFQNEPAEIYNAFKPYYTETTIEEVTDPHQLYRLQHSIEDWRSYTEEEINAFCEVWFRKRLESTPGEHKAMDTIVNKAVERFKQLKEEEQEQLKGQLSAFRNLYAYLSQVIPFQDSDLEKLYTYLRFLILKLPKRESDVTIKIDDDVTLKYYRLQKISEGSIDLKVGEPEPLYGPTEVGTAGLKDEKVVLSELIEKLNERFGTDFKDADRLYFEQVKQAAVENEKIKEAAQANTMDNFRHIWEKMITTILIDRMQGNEKIFQKLMDDKIFRGMASEHLMKEVYNWLRR